MSIVVNDLDSVISRLSQKDLVIQRCPTLVIGYTVGDKFISVGEELTYENTIVKITLTVGIKNHKVKILNKITETKDWCIITPKCIISDEYNEAIYNLNKMFKLKSELHELKNNVFHKINKKGGADILLDRVSELESLDNLLNKTYKSIYEIADYINKNKNEYDMKGIIIDNRH